MITCRFPDGAKTSLRHVAVDAFIIEKNKVLLIKRGKHLTNAGKYAFPGGYLDRDETTVQATVREAKEETGYDVEIEKLLTVRDSPDRNDEGRQNIAFIYLAKPISQTGKPDDEVEDVKWFDLDDLPIKTEFAFDHYQVLQEYKKKYTA